MAVRQWRRTSRRLRETETGEKSPATSLSTHRTDIDQGLVRSIIGVVLADAVEAASRTLPEPSPVRLRALVHKLIMKKLLDGQLDDSPLTLADLAKAEKSFVPVLTAIFHSHVRYPPVAMEGEPAAHAGLAESE